jgi:glycosyltransferase involved in cell wall biosynthesis
MLFSIIIPTYNRASLIAVTVRSVLSQSYPNFEVIVVDDGGTDNTAEVLNEISDKRLKYYRKENEERAAARNFGTLLSKGDYVTFLDSDDVLFPNHLQEACDLITGKMNPEWVHLRYKISNYLNETIAVPTFSEEEDLNRKLLYGNYLSCMGVFLRRDVAIKNQFNTSRQLSGSEDHELWLRMAAQYTLYANQVITAALIDHDGRSVVDVDKAALIRRQDKFTELVLSNPSLKSFISGNEKRLRSNSSSYVSLHLALTGQHKKLVVEYLIRSLRANVSMVFSRRFVVILKHLFLTW